MIWRKQPVLTWFFFVWNGVKYVGMSSEGFIQPLSPENTDVQGHQVESAAFVIAKV